MNHIRAMLAASTLLVFVTAAHAAPGRHYRVEELQVPDSLRQSCLPGYAEHAGPSSLNDSGVVVAGFSCYTEITPEGAAYQKSGPFIAASWFGSLALPVTGPQCCSWAQNINNLGQSFGAENMDSGGFAGAIWSLGGGRERVFDLESCDQIRFSAAVGGNGRYTLGWALRGDPAQPPPLDTLCIYPRWLFSSASGVETLGPIGGYPSGINSSDVALGTVNRSAVSFTINTAETRVLHAADATHSLNTSGINDLGEAAGWIAQDGQPGYANTCDPGAALRWAGNGSELALPHLPGAVSSRAWGVGYHGETVGDSGRGGYCEYLGNAGERAVLWQGSRAIDLNTLIPRAAGVTLTSAVSINRRGQIAAAGYSRNEPLVTCLQTQYPPTGPVNVPVPCHHMHAYLLTPVGR